MSTYKRLLFYMKPYMPRFTVAILCIIFAAAGNLYVPWIMKDVIDEVLAQKNMTMLNTIAVGIVIVFFFRGIFFYGQTYLMSYIAQRVIIDIREDLYKHLQTLSLAYYEKRKTGTIMSYITNDVAALQAALVSSMVEIVQEGAILIGSLATMFFLHWKLSLLTMITVPIIAQAMKIFGRKLKKTSGIMQERIADITSVLQEAISSVRVVKTFVREEYEIGRFREQNISNFRAQMKNTQVMATLSPVVEFLAAIGVTAIIWYGGFEVVNGNLTSGALIAFLVYAVNLSNPVKRLSRLFGEIQKALAAAERVFEVLDTQTEVKEKEHAIELPMIDGKVSFQQVTFEYKPNELALDHVNLEVESGQMVAIVGPSGAGKSTIANLIPRFYDLKSGSIYIDDIDITDVKLNSLREQIGIVPQETILFNGSIYDNILYGNLNATKSEVINATIAANAHDFIMAMPDGYDTQIGERGTSLSGGQRQRIAIARAILKDPRILILDEATSALDTESEKIVQAALDKLMIGRTSFVIAHRLSTILNADCIIVMEKGKIVEQGTHQELLKLNGLYSSLYKIQFNK
ncbi:lipid A export permease/ATP-binding protein MsbA [Anaerosinus massiliensis]|uniref:lipid A export permease/ATP-binding protein MsbA n=1 Tax=Massilibacillus massiliensis TaxID=1806837 RepID=UPI000AE1899D|nr:lipid A export permease/ATP-binding protein MsbA [Massilibacillus massiliensis]